MTANMKHLDAIFLRLNVLDRKASWTSPRASLQMGHLVEDVQDLMNSYLEEEFPDWRKDKELSELFNR